MVIKHLHINIGIVVHIEPEIIIYFLMEPHGYVHGVRGVMLKNRKQVNFKINIFEIYQNK